MWIFGPLFLLSCATPPKQQVPDDSVLPFPFHMVQKDNFLFINGTNADAHYGFGRLMAINTDALDAYLKSDKKKNPIPASEVVRSNTLIPGGASMMSVANDVLMASSVSNKFYKLPLRTEGLSCNKPGVSIDHCPEVKSLPLSGTDPLRVNTLKTSATETIVALAYAASSYIDLISVKAEALTKIKAINMLDVLNRASKKIPVDELVVVKKIQIEGDKIYLLVEQQFKSLTARFKEKNSFLVSMVLEDFLNKETLSADDISVWDLKDLFFITGVHDSFIDQNTAYILAKSPEALFKIDLSRNHILDRATSCMSASSLSVSKSMNRIIMPCFGDNHIASFSMSPLVLELSTPILGQGPIYALIDEVKKYIYVSFFKEGKLMIFDENLRYLGHIFEPPSLLKGPSS